MFENLNGYLSLAIIGLFTGLGSATGAAFVELWLKPHLKDWKENPKEFQKNVLDRLKGMAR